MKLVRLESFERDFQRLPAAVQKQAKEKIRLLLENPKPPYHPSLRIKKMKGHESVWEGHISIEYVFTMQWDNDPETGELIVIFRRIGRHDIYRKP